MSKPVTIALGLLVVFSATGFALSLGLKVLASIVLVSDLDLMEAVNLIGVF